MNEAHRPEKQLAENGEVVARKSDILVAVNGMLREAVVCATQEQLAKTMLSIAEDPTDSKFGWIGQSD